MEIKFWMIIISILYLIWSYFSIKNLFFESENPRIGSMLWIVSIGVLCAVFLAWIFSFVNWSFLETVIIRI